jgi:hypothetical protein
MSSAHELLFRSVEIHLDPKFSSGVVLLLLSSYVATAVASFSSFVSSSLLLWQVSSVQLLFADCFY